MNHSPPTKIRSSAITRFVPPLNFITIHYAYFIITCLATSLVFWRSPVSEGRGDKGRIEFVDSLFLVVSAMTEAGLNTVNLSEMTTFQQVILFLLIIMGSTIFVSVGTIWTRKRVFEKRFKGIVKGVREGKRRANGGLLGGNGSGREVSVGERLEGQRKEREGVDERVFESRHSGPRDPTSGPLGIRSRDLRMGERDLAGESKIDGDSNVIGDKNHISIMRQETSGPTTGGCGRLLNFVEKSDHSHRTKPITSASGSAYGHPQLPSSSLSHRTENKTDGTEKVAGSAELDQAMYPHYLTRRTTKRNAQFYGLTREEREHLGGVEYRAITLLGWVVPLYFVAWQVLGCIGLGTYMSMNKVEVIRANGINPWWLGVFNGVSAFNNSGMSLLDANLIPFQTSVYTLLTMGMMILAGNTAYPLILRLILWLMLKILTFLYPNPSIHSTHKATLRFILAYPRRVYTNLFPAAPTLWLLFMVITLNGIDWIAFELLNIGNAAVEAIPAHFRVLDGLFQALAVRSGGFYIIGISELRIGLQVLYVLMMYISVYPVVITMRHSNVYEERSLGIYAEDNSSLFSADDTDEESNVGNVSHDHTHISVISKPQGTLSTLLRTLSTFTTAHPTSQTRTQFIRQQIRGQLAHDIWLLVLAVLIISCIEVSSFEADPVTFSVFNIIFEVMSGYGCVGISTGMKGEAYSFSGGWKTASKIVLCGVMLRGRHRGLPVAIDRAVRLPGWEEEMEEEGKDA